MIYEESRGGRRDARREGGYREIVEVLGEVGKWYVSVAKEWDLYFVISLSHL